MVIYLSGTLSNLSEDMYATTAFLGGKNQQIIQKEDDNILELTHYIN